MYFRLLFVLFCVGIFCSVECRRQKNVTLTSQDIRTIKRLSRYLDDQKSQKNKKERVTLQNKKAIEKQIISERRKMERQVRHQKKKIARKQKARRVAMLRKERIVEKRRLTKIAGWRHYFDSRKAAASLIEAINDTDKTNQLHVSQLQAQIRSFSQERLKGNIEKYPELKKFLALKS